LNPKDRELCQHRLKSGENLMEDRSDTDVQIDFVKCWYSGERLIERSSSWFHPKFLQGK